MTSSSPDHTHDDSFGTGVAASLRRPSVELRRKIPAVYEGFKHLHDEAFADGALDRRTKELIALAIAVADQCDGCIASHARGCVEHGASEDEVAETIGVCILMMGGPGTVYGPRAYSAYQEFVQQKAARATA
jgi:AhpD family alkylhydroperoxidase